MRFPAKINTGWLKAPHDLPPGKDDILLPRRVAVRTYGRAYADVRNARFARWSSAKILQLFDDNNAIKIQKCKSLTEVTIRSNLKIWMGACVDLAECGTFSEPGK